ncbi:MAG: amidohydrolase [Chloroflexi bacterium]|nr:amidohydrolase [Chloroflexota bacterium]
MDTVFLGGNVLTMDPRNSRVGALAVKDGKIAAVGASAEIAKLVSEGTRSVSLAGRTLLPGFIDPHNHFSINVLEPVAVDCSVPPLASISGVLETLSAAASSTPPGRWIRGWGLRAALLQEERAVTRWELDEVSPSNPVCIIDASVHACYLNSAALKLAGIDRNTPDPPHGQILKDKKGDPDGTLWEGALDLAYNISLRAYMDSYGDVIAGLVRDNCMRHLACGITSVGDALVVPDAAALYQLADANGSLPMVLHQMLGGSGFFAPPREVASGEYKDGNVSDRLRGGTMKIFMDPVYPATARTRFHADGHKEQVGEIYYSQEAVDRLVVDAHERGLQVAIHCLGNRAVDQALNAFERALKARPVSDPRFRIEHFTITTSSQIKRAQSLGVIAVVQPTFNFTGGERYQSTIEELSGDTRAIPLQTMLSEGLTVAASSDYPCAPLEPLTGLYSMVTRRTRSTGQPAGLEEAVSVMDGLRMYTANAAYAMGRDQEAGSLEVGKRADMVVLSHDPTAVNPDFLRDISVEQTYVDGELLHGAQRS